jgi:hypothetical protein
MFAAIGKGNGVTEEADANFAEAAVAGGAGGFLVSQLIGLGEAFAIWGCALEVLGKQTGHNAVVDATPSAHLRSISMMYFAVASSDEAQ